MENAFQDFRATKRKQTGACTLQLLLKHIIDGTVSLALATFFSIYFLLFLLGMLKDENVFFSL
jgi:hypothetical protein